MRLHYRRTLQSSQNNLETQRCTGPIVKKKKGVQVHCVHVMQTSGVHFNDLGHCDILTVVKPMEGLRKNTGDS